MRALAVLVLIPLLGTGADVPPPHSPDENDLRTLRSLRHLVLTANGYKADEGAYPGPTDGFVTVEYVRPYFTPVHIREMPELDGWGNPFRYFSDGKRMAIGSYGADGKPDAVYASPDDLRAGAGDDLFWSGGRLAACPAAVCELEKAEALPLTVLEIRSLGQAAEAYREAHGTLPVSNAYVAAAFVRPKLGAYVPKGRVADLWGQQRLRPYFLEFPLVDGWGNTLLYWSDGKSYRVVSVGSDGRPDRPFEEVAPGTVTQEPETDLVFGDGAFLQGPPQKTR